GPPRLARDRELTRRPWSNSSACAAMMAASCASRRPSRGETMKASSLLAFALVATGCSSVSAILNSASQSSNAVIESLKSPFDSSSKSSGGGGGTALNYQRDVHSYALACLARDDEPSEFLRGMSRVAELHGVSDWEESPDTYVALHALVAADELDTAGLERLRAGLAPLGPEKVARAFGEASPRQ